MKQVRNMEPRDLPALWKMTRAQNRRDGTNYPFPEVFNLDESSPGFGKLMPNVLLALVTEIDGRVRQGHVWLRTVEEMHFGGGREVTEFSLQHLEAVLAILKQRGYYDVHEFVPKCRTEEVEPMLVNEKFHRIDHRLAHFYREL